MAVAFGRSTAALCMVVLVFVPLFCHIDGIQAATGDGHLKEDIAGHSVGGKTDDGAVEREEQAMSYDGFSVHERKMLEASQEKHEFQAEVSRLMGLLIHSLYSNKEIFLRELISNASDALDKIRYLSLTDSKVLGEGDQAKLEIKIETDPKRKTFTISDTGVGMTKAELAANLGTIASSGTKRFIEGVLGGESKDAASLIGQFGVGFYSVFLVCDEVSVTSKHNDDDQYVWTSTADSNFKMAKDPRGNTLGRGTRITLKLKEDAYEFLEEAQIRKLVKNYSEFINFPIYLKTTVEEEIDVPLTDEELAKAKEERAAKRKEEDEAEEVDSDSEESKKADDEEEVGTTKKVKSKRSDWELVNSTKPIWTRNKDDVTEEEYHDFYKALTKETEDPLAYTHFTVEGSGEVDFKSILFVPGKASSELFQNYQAKMHNIRLYVRRVFITDDFEDILPKYLNFIKGMVDSDHLPLNVSREMLQQHKMLKTIKKSLTRKVLALIKDLAEDEDKKSDYDKFYKEFGTSLKLGVIEDTGNRMKIAKLLRFKSSKSGGELTSFDEYIGRMKEKQRNIYYLAGESIEQVENSPYLEVLLKRGLECLYLTDPVDEYALTSLGEYESKKLMNVGKEGLEYEDDEDKGEDFEAEYADLLVYLKTTLSDNIEKAVISKRLYTTPSALVTGYFGYTPNMERIVKSQAMSASDQASAFQNNNKKNLEINPRHPLVKELRRRVEESRDEPATKDLALMIFQTAAVASGYSLGDATDFVKRVHHFMMMGLNLDPNAPIDKDEALENLAEREAERKEKAAAAGDAEAAEEVDADHDAEAAHRKGKEEEKEEL